MSRERDPLLSKNCEVDTNDKLTYGLLTLQDSGGGTTNIKITQYDDEAVGSFSALFYYTGTVLANGQTWRTCSVYWVLSAFCAIILIFDRTHGMNKLKPLDSPEQKESFEDLTTYLSALAAFLIAFFVGNMVHRWWSVRCYLTNLFTFIHDLISRISIRMRKPSDRHYLDRILRLCLLSTRLVFYEARGTDSKEDLEKLVKQSLMTNEELEALNEKPGKSLVVWMWINCVFRFLNKSEKMEPLSPPVLARFDGIFTGASSAISNMLTYIDTQVPFSYVHTLFWLVVLNNTLIAVKCGIFIGNAVGPGGYPDSTVVVCEVAHVFMVPFVYHSLLNLGLQVANPFGTDVIDFPIHHITVHWRDVEVACMEAVEHVPSTVLEDSGAQV